MKSYNKKRMPTGRNIFLVAFITAIISLFVALPTTARLQEAQLQRVINVGTEATATILGATTSQHLSGNGAPATYDVTPANLRARAIAVGDVNGDGIPDIVTGAPEATFTVTPATGPADTRTGAGIVYVVLGKAALTGAIDTATGGAEISILGIKTGDNLGFAVAVGDVNGDGIADISIGAPGADFPGSVSPAVAARADTGAVFVIFGSAALSNPHTIDLATTNAANVAMFGVNTGDRFGTAVAVGNVGGLSAQSATDQAVKDILTGAPGNAGPGSARPGAGAAYVQFGGPILNPVGGATNVIDLAATPANVIILGKTGDACGASVAIGDINGGGIADAIVGAPLADRPAAGVVPAGTDTGAVFAVLGGPNLVNVAGTSKTFDINTTQQNVSVYGAGNTSTPGSDDADHLGVSVAVGDVTGDGTPDLSIGAPDADGPGETRSNAGEAYVLEGGTNFNATGGSERRIDLFNATPLATVFGAQAGDRFGSTVANGNYNTVENTDNILDLIVSAPGASGKAGNVSVIFGGSNLALLTLRDLFLGQDNLRIFGQSGGNTDLSAKTLRIRQTLTTADQGVTPFLQQLLVSINGATPVVNDDTQAQFGAGTLTRVTAASTVIAADTTAVGNLQLSANPSLVLDGTTSAMSVANSASLQPGTGSWTVEFWIKRTGAGVGDFPVVIGSRPWTSTSDKGWAVALAQGSFNVGAHFGDGAAASPINVVAVQSATTVALGTWQHWAVVFNRAQNQVLFYKNGVIDNTVTATFPTGTVDQADTVLIGKDLVTSATRFLAANLDDIRVWNAARTAQQIQDNFKNELLGTETGLAANWNFNAGNTEDLTSNNNDGTLVGAASIAGLSDRFFLTGTRLSTFTFPAATTATTSLISWIQTAAASTSIKVETSLDGGTTFQTATSGSGIPSVTNGDELGWAIATGDVNNNQGGELIIGAPFANAVSATGSRTQAGVVYILPSTSAPPPVNQPPTVTVTAPNGGETLQLGQMVDLTWTASDPNGDATITKFEIRLSTDGGTNFNFTITPNVAGDLRKFTWTVPVGFNTTQGRIRVIVTDNQNATAQDASDANFTITDAGVTATLTFPNGGESLRFGQSVAIAWTVPLAVAASVKGFDLNLSTDGGVTFPIQIAPSGDPAQPAIAAGSRTFQWTVPSFCTTLARVAVVTTSLSNVRVSDTSNANFVISDVGPTIDTANMRINFDFQLLLLTTAPAGGTEVLFGEGTVVEISSDAAGTTFFGFSKPNGKIKKGGAKYLSKGLINGQELGVFFPNGATRFIRITKPTCRITLLRVTRVGEQLMLAAADVTDAEATAQPQVSQ